MKVKLLAIMVFMAAVLGGCNQKMMIDPKFDKVTIRLQDGNVITVDVEAYCAGDSNIIIETKDGKLYCVSYVNATFYTE